MNKSCFSDEIILTVTKKTPKKLSAKYQNKNTHQKTTNQEPVNQTHTKNHPEQRRKWKSEDFSRTG